MLKEINWVAMKHAALAHAKQLQLDPRIVRVGAKQLQSGGMFDTHSGDLQRELGLLHARLKLVAGESHGRAIAKRESR